MPVHHYGYYHIWRCQCCRWHSMPFAGDCIPELSGCPKCCGEVKLYHERHGIQALLRNIFGCAKGK